MNYLTKGSEKLAARQDFTLVGRDADLERLTAILLRDKSRSVILVGPGGVGCSALCLGLQASKNDPDAPFDVVSKRLFWLDTDGLFSSGSAEQITENFNKIIDVLNRTPESILIIEDARDFIDASRANGLGNFINSLNNAVKKDKTQIIFETRDDDLDVVLKAHSDMRERYTLIDLAEPAREALRQIVINGAKNLTQHHGIRISEAAIDAAIELTSKYRTRDAGLSRAQPERTMTLLDRALATYRLHAHKQHAGMAQLLRDLGDRVNTAEGQAQIAELDSEFKQSQQQVKELYRLQRQGEAAILELEQEVEQVQAQEEAKAKSPTSTAMDDETAQRITRLRMSPLAHGGFDSAAVAALRSKIREFQGLVNENRAKFDALTATINAQLEISRDVVVEQFSLISGISASKLNQDERKKLKVLEANMAARVFGQEAAVHRLANAIKVAKVGKRSSNEPLASFLFMGPSGVGKTELAKVLTLNLLDDEEALTRFDMSEFMEKHAVAKLIGAPPGYEGFEAGGILTNAMRKNPVRVLLFDEIEKAHPDVFNIFLQILSDSRLTDNVGRVVSFDDAVIIMTTNIGQTGFLDTTLSDDEAQAAAMVELEATYRPELLNRFAGRENIVCFHRLGLDSVGKIIRREADKISDKYAGNGIAFDFPDASIAAFCHDQYKPMTGARGLPGYLKANLEPILAELALDRPDFSGTVTVCYNEERHGFDTVITDNNSDTTVDNTSLEMTDEHERSVA